MDYHSSCAFSHNPSETHQPNPKDDEMSKTITQTLTAAVFSLAICGLSPAAITVTVWQDDDPLSASSSAGNGLTVTTIANPTGGGTPGNVGALDESSAGAFSSIVQAATIDASAYAGSTFTLSFNWFVPATTSATGNDLFYVQVGFNGVNSGSAGFINELANAGAGWQTFTWNTGPVIPAATTDLDFFIIHVDGGFGGPPTQSAGTLMYIDNILATVDVIPEPSTTILGGLGMAGLLVRRRRS